MNIEHYRRGDLAGDTGAHIALQSGIKGQNKIVAGLALIALELTNNAAVGVDLNLTVAGLAAQSKIVNFLDPAFADTGIGKRKQRIAGQFVLGNRPCRPRSGPS